MPRGRAFPLIRNAAQRTETAILVVGGPFDDPTSPTRNIVDYLGYTGRATNMVAMAAQKPLSCVSSHTAASGSRSLFDSVRS
jgi:hypothetical protein